MLNTHTSVLARRIWIDAEYATPAYEAGWAAEAIFFLQAEGDHPELRISAEVSPDGINWIRRGEPQTLSAQEPAAETSLTIFGNWIRLVVTGASEKRRARILVHLSLKG